MAKAHPQPSTASIAEIRAMQRLAELALISDEPDRLTRLYLTPAHKRAALQVKSWMEDAGLRARIDAIGNVVGRFEAAEKQALTLFIGSHIDTVRNAGKFDGALGVIVAIEALAELQARGVRLPFAIEILAFGDEEGVRFSSTLAGSRAISGTLHPTALDANDADGVSVREALAAFGCSPDPHRLARNPEDVLGYIEVHIEQGPVLETEDLPVGIVTAISGASRIKVKVDGTAGHSGTVPMKLRRDAAAAAAEMILAIEKRALNTPDLIATVGCFEIKPGVVNVIAGEADISIDIRSPSDGVRLAAIAALREELADIAQRRDVGLTTEVTYDQHAAICDAQLVQVCDKAVRALGLRSFHLPSGAGHDGLAMTSLCPIAMLFVRNRGGISHSPEESVQASDVGFAIRGLVEVLLQLGAAETRRATSPHAKPS